MLLLSSSARAVSLPDENDHVLPCRPTIACTADLVPPGTVELEAGYLLRRLGSGALQHTLPWLLKLTLLPWVQFQVGSNGVTLSSGGEAVPIRYQDDITVGFKLHPQDQDADKPSLSFSATASIPTAPGQNGYLRTYDALFTLYITKDFRLLHADLNAGLNVWRLETQPLAQGFVALALSVELPRHFGFMMEGYGFSDAAPVSPADAGILVAVSYSPLTWLMLDLGGDGGLIPATRRVSLFAGFTMIPLRLWRGSLSP
jgi:hypothetical protein